jgi:aromatic-L-amino-acid decarboxylase
VDEDMRFERMAEVPFSVVCFRLRPAAVTDEAALEGINQQLLDRVNTSGEVFLSHTKVGGRFVLRLAVGNLRTTEAHVRRAWELLKTHAAAPV